MKQSYVEPVTAPDSSFDVGILIADSAADAYAQALGNHYRVHATAEQRMALSYVQRHNPPLMVAGPQLNQGSPSDLCREAKRQRFPPSVLAMAAPEDVPDLLIAGCDGVLLTPVAPSLLVNRVSRMLRARFGLLQLRAAHRRLGAPHRVEGDESLEVGTNRNWSSTACPHCASLGVTSFDYASMRRAWYACLRCRKVWMAKRLDI